jgi:hypothetical protein
VSRQRTKRKKGTLSEERIRLLAGLGFEWERGSGKTLGEKERTNTAEGKAAVSPFTGLNRMSTTSFPELEDHRDARWEERFRELAQYRERRGDCNVPNRSGSLGTWATKQRRSKRKGMLSEERFLLLDGLGFEWERGPRKKCAKKERANTAEDEAAASPVSASSQLSTTAVSALEEHRVACWEDHFRELAQYRERRGDCNVPNRAGKLGGWVSR